MSIVITPNENVSGELMKALLEMGALPVYPEDPDKGVVVYQIGHKDEQTRVYRVRHYMPHVVHNSETGDIEVRKVDEEESLSISWQLPAKMSVEEGVWDVRLSRYNEKLDHHRRNMEDDIRHAAEGALGKLSWDDLCLVAGAIAGRYNPRRRTLDGRDYQSIRRRIYRMMDPNDQPTPKAPPVSMYTLAVYKMTPAQWEEAHTRIDPEPYVVPRNVKMDVNGLPGVHLSLTAHQDRVHCGIFVFSEDGEVTEALDGYTIGGTVFENGQTRCPIEIMDAPDLCTPDGVPVELEVVGESPWGKR